MTGSGSLGEPLPLAPEAPTQRGARDVGRNRGSMLFRQTLRSRLAAAVVGGAALASVTGCAATVTARPARTAVLYDYPVVYVDRAPVRVYERRSVHFHGRPAYLIDGRWYYRSNRGWLYFRDEPAELRRARTRDGDVHVQARPPRRRYVEERPVRRRLVEEPSEGRRRRYD